MTSDLQKKNPLPLQLAKQCFSVDKSHVPGKM